MQVPFSGPTKPILCSIAPLPSTLSLTRLQVPMIPLTVQAPSNAQQVLSAQPVPLKPIQSAANFQSCQPIHLQSTPFPQAAVSPPTPTTSLVTFASGNVPVRDSTWLKMRVCSAFLKQLMMGDDVPEMDKCSYTEETCPLAHPQPNVRIENDHVTVCFDFIKRSECRHANCKYYHPPKHQTEAVLKRGDITKKNSSNQGSQSVMQQTPLGGFGCWPGAPPFFLNPALAPMNPTAAVAMLAAMRGGGGGPTSGGFYPSMLPQTSVYPAALSDPTSLASLVAGLYQLPRPTSALSSSGYGTADIVPGAQMATPFFTPGGVSPSVYAAAVAAVNATQQQTAVSAHRAPSTSNSAVDAKGRGEDLPTAASATTLSGRKREATNFQMNLHPPKRVNKECEDVADNAVMGNAAPVSCQTQLASTIAFNSWLQQQQQQQQHLSSPPPPPLPSAHHQTSSAALQAATLMRLQQQQQQQQWVTMAAGYGQLAGLTPNPVATAAYANPAILFDPLAFQPNGLTTNPYAANLLQNQPVLTNVAYINDEGQLLESLPICRDFKAAKCHRNADCRYVHLLDENVEVNQGRVTVCRDAAKGRCTRVPCKYYHIPLLAISASRSLALNSALSAAVGANAYGTTVFTASPSSAPVTSNTTTSKSL